MAAGAEAQELTRLRAVVHVHTDFSTGDLPLDEIVARAERQGIEAIFLAENFLLRVEYGLPPLRSVLRFAREEPSVLARGVERYLGRIEEARRRHPRMVLVPGVEVMPHYRWTGSPLDTEFTVHNLQKNILVFGLSTGAALQSLPAIGNPATAVYSAESVVAALPVVLLVPGLWLLLKPGVAFRRIGGRIVARPRRRWGSGGALCAIAVAALWRGFPFTTEIYSPYRDLGIAPYQELIDAAEGQGGAAVWSFPDAFDFGEQRPLGIRVTRRTEPHGDDLLRTYRYSAFGGVYEDTTRFALLGGGWDYLLAQFAKGERSRAAWLIGESGFHGDGDRKWIGAAETVFLVPAKTEAAALDALRRGRAYGVLRTDQTNTPVLERFAVSAAAGAGISGDALSVPTGTRLDVQIGVGMSDASEQSIRVNLIKNGSLVRVWTGLTPLTLRHQEPFDGTPSYFRLDVRGPKTTYVLSNPIFIRPATQ
jgi:hypothetical protein